MEVLSTASSVAGLVGLSGQLLNGIILLKDFVSDVKNAPEDVKLLSREIKILADSVKQVEILIADCGRYGVQLDEAEYKLAFEQCIDVVQKMGVMVERDIKGLGGKAKWLGRLKSAAGKKQVESYMVKVERAKTQVIMIESQITLKLQQQHQLALAQTTTSIQSIENKSRTATTWTKSVDGRLDGLSTEMIDIKNQLREVITNLGGVCQNMSTYSAMEAMIESAVSRELKKHQWEVASIDHNKAPSSSSRIPFFDESLRTRVATDRNQMIQPATQLISESSYRPLPSQSITLLRQNKFLHRSRFRTPFLQIEILTTEVRRRQKTQDGNESYPDLTFVYKQKFTEYQIRINLPFWKSLNVFNTGQANYLYGNNFYRSLKTYNIVPSDAPIFRACYSFDLLEVQRLFEAGVASPMDVTPEDTTSLVERVLGYFLATETSPELATKAFNLLRFLIHSVGGDVEACFLSRWVAFHFERQPLIVRAQTPFGKEYFHILTEIIRLIAANTSKDPFDHEFAGAVMNDPFHPLYPTFSSQDGWWIESDIKTYYPNLEGFFVETVCEMRNDPLGLSLQTALSEAKIYVPYFFGHEINYHLFNETQYAPFHQLLAFTAQTIDETVKRACLTRLVIFLKYQHDPRQLHCLIRYGTLTYNDLQQHLALSPTGLAELLGLQKFWRSALEDAGWSTSEIQDLRDEDTFLGVPALLDGSAIYSTLEEQRVDFVEKLRCGFYVDMDIDEISRVVQLMEFELNHGNSELQDVIAEASSCFRQRSTTPGSWCPEEGICLEPGVDFNLPVGWINCENDTSQDWRCIRDIWSWNYRGYHYRHHCLFPDIGLINEKDI